MYNSNSHVVYKLHVKLEHFSLCFFKLLSKNPCFLHFYWILLKIIKVVWISQRFNQMLLNNVTQILRVERHGLILAEKVHIMCILCISGRDIYMFILCKTSAFFCLDKGGGEESGPSGQTGEARASNPEDTEGSQLNSETSSTSADSPPKQLPDQISFFSGNPCVEIVYGIMHLYKTKWVTGPKFSALKFREMNMLMFRVQTIVDGHIFVLIFVSFFLFLLLQQNDFINWRCQTQCHGVYPDRAGDHDQSRSDEVHGSIQWRDRPHEDNTGLYSQPVHGSG